MYEFLFNRCKTHLDPKFTVVISLKNSSTLLIKNTMAQPKSPDRNYINMKYSLWMPVFHIKEFWLITDDETWYLYARQTVWYQSNIVYNYFERMHI